MNNEEIQSLIKQLKATGLGEEEIMDVFYEAFEKGEMDRKDLESLSEAMGYELTDDFKNDSQPDPISAPEGEGEGEITKSEAEDLKEIKPGESAEEFKDKVEEAKSDDVPEAPKAEEKSEPEEKPEEKSEDDKPEGEAESEDKDWEEAQKVLRV